MNRSLSHSQGPADDLPCNSSQSTGGGCVWSERGERIGPYEARFGR